MNDEREPPGPMPWLILVCVAYLVAYALVVQHASIVQQWAGLSLAWNWSGKLFGIAFSLIVIASSPWLRRNVGLTWRQAPGSLPLSVLWLAVCLALGVTFGMIDQAPPHSIETLLYQATLPPLDEELAMRGIALALLERAFGRSPMSCRLRFGMAGFITSLVFAIGHYELLRTLPGGAAMIAFLIFFGSAAIDALVRTRSGSLLWPILAHSAWDGGWALVKMLR